jgi:PKD repeat protein
LIDDVAYNDGSTSEIGPPPAPPVASFTYNPVGLAVSFDATGSTTTPPATITNYAWVFGDSGTGTGATPSHTYLTAGSYTVGLTVTDSNGGTSSTSQTVGVGGTTSATVASVITSTGWTPVSGTIASVLSDTSLTSLFITSNAYPSNLPLRLKLTGMSAPPTGVGLTVPIAIERSSDSQSASVICKLYDSNGTTLRSTLAAIAVNGVASGTTVDPSNFIEPLFPAADCATVTDWSGVVIELDVTAS